LEGILSQRVHHDGIVLIDDEGGVHSVLAPLDAGVYAVGDFDGVIRLRRRCIQNG
jgi:hypothetical protein